MQSTPRRSKLRWHASLTCSGSLRRKNFTSGEPSLPSMMPPNLVARKISSRLPVRLNHFPRRSSESPCLDSQINVLHKRGTQR